MKTSNFFKSVFSLAMMTGLAVSSHALTFDYDTHGGAVVEDTPITFDALNYWYKPDSPLYCDDILNTDGTCDHGIGNPLLHPEGSPRLDNGVLDVPPIDAKDYLTGFWSYGLHFEAESSTVEFPGVCWGKPGPLSPDPTEPPFTGVSGETFGGFAGTVDVDGSPKLFGVLTHFNRSLDPEKKPPPWGFDTKIDWYLHLEKDGNPVIHKKFVYQLYFYETYNLQNPCPRNQLGVGVQGNINVTLYHGFQYGGSHTHTFFADGKEDLPKDIDPEHLGCDDATTFKPVPEESDSDWFVYNNHVYKINIHGFYPAIKDNNGEFTGECDLSEGPVNTMWSEESTESVGCVLFNIKQLEGCDPKFWRFQGLSQQSYMNCITTYGCSCPGFMCCIRPFVEPLYEKWGIDPNTDFDEAFDITNNCTGNMTLMTALNQWYPYGGYMHTVTALLNAMNLSNYYYTVDQVKEFVQDRCSDGSLDNQDLKELSEIFKPFNLANNCPLDKVDCSAPICNTYGYLGGP